MSQQASNKATFQNEGFLAKLSSTLMGRLPPSQIDTKSTLKWHKTSDVKKRIKTATGTIAVYSDTTKEEEEKIEESVKGIPALGEEIIEIAEGEIPPPPPEPTISPEPPAPEKRKIDTVTEKQDVEISSEKIESFTAFVAKEDYTSEQSDGLSLVRGQKVIKVENVPQTSPHKKQRTDDGGSTELLDNAAAKHKMSIRPPKHHPDPRSRSPVPKPPDERWLVRDFETGKEGYVPTDILENAPVGSLIADSLKRTFQEMTPEECREVKMKVTQEVKEMRRSRVLGPSMEEEASVKRLATVNELLETEDEFVQDINYVVDKYYSAAEDPSAPTDVRENKNTVFSNMTAIAEFHQKVLLEGLKFNADVPKMIGKTFLRLERDFDKHAEYCSQEPLAQEILETNDTIRKYFEKVSKKNSDEKQLHEHLKLPIQRINDYQLLLKELVKYSVRTGDEPTELERAHELMQTIPQRATDAKFIESIEGYKGNLFKLGRLIRHDWFSVAEVGHKARERYLFLFNARILITKVKSISEERSVFVLKEIIRLPETTLGSVDTPKGLEFIHIEPQNHPNYPLVLEARTEEVKEAWLKVVEQHIVDTASVEDLLFDDELRIVSQEDELFGYASPQAEYDDLEDLPEDIVDNITKEENILINNIESKEEEVIKLVNQEEEQQIIVNSTKTTTEEPDFWATTEVETEKVTVEEFWDKTEISKSEVREEKQISESVNLETTEVDFWTKSETGEVQVHTEQKKQQSSEQLTVEEDFWGTLDKGKSETKLEEKQQILAEQQTDETDFWTKESTDKSKVEVEKYPTVESLQSVTEETDFWAQKSSDKLIAESLQPDTEEKDFWTEVEAEKPEVKEKKSPTVEETLQTATEETDFWAQVEENQEVEQKGKDSITTLLEVAEFDTKKSEKESDEYPLDSKKAANEETDFWLTAESDNLEGKEVGNNLGTAESVTSKEVEICPETGSEKFEETDFWAQADSNKSEINIEKILVDSEVSKTSGEDFWSTLETETTEVKKSEKTESEETDFWASTEVKKSASKEEKDTKETAKEKEFGLPEEKESYKGTKKRSSEIVTEEKPKSKKTKSGKSKKDGKDLLEEPYSSKEEYKEETKDQTCVSPFEEIPSNKRTLTLDSTEEIKDTSKKQKSDYLSDHEAINIKSENLEKENYLLKEEDSKSLLSTPKLEEKETNKKEQKENKKEEEDFWAALESSNTEISDTNIVDNENKNTPTSVEENKTSAEESQPETLEGKIFDIIKTKKSLEQEDTKNKADSKEKSKEESKSASAEEKQEEPVITDNKTKGIEIEIVEKKPEPEEKKQQPEEPAVPKKEEKKEKKQKKLSKKEEEPKQTEMAEPPTPGTGPKPLFTKTLRGDVVEPGEGVSFSCEVAHPDNYYVTWLKDNKPLDDKLADRIQQQDEGMKHTLKMLNCRIEDSGVYTAKATDPNAGSSTCSAQLLVHEFTEEEREARLKEKSPFFLVKMKPTEVIENTNLSYAVHVKGDPMPTVDFYKDKKKLVQDDRVKVRSDPDHGHYELLISHVRKEDAGIYKCYAENKYGSAECEAVMTVADEQNVLENLHGKGSLLKEGEKADFKWFRDGVEFDPVERFNVMFKDEEDTLALVFQNVTPEDAGLYTCVASTSCGKISCSAELTVEGSINRLMKDPEPPSFSEKLEDSSAILGGTAMLECKVAGFPRPELTWTKNGEDIKLGSRVKMLWEDDTSATLVIKNIDEGDKGKYKVKAKNELGEADSECKLTIKSAPKFRKLDKLVGCTLGQTLNCVVEVDGEPLPEVKWMKDGKDLSETDKISFEKKPDGTFTLKIKTMSSEDCGNYTIVATNDMGQRTENFEVQAETPPEIIRGLETETEKKFKNDHTFEVRAKGSPMPTAAWFKDGKEITDDDHYKITHDDNFYMLTVKNLSRHDKGTYKIVLTNLKGKAESEGKLLIRAPPEFTSTLEDSCAKEGAKDVKLTVNFESNPRPTVKWSLNGKAIHDDTPGYSIETTDVSATIVLKSATPEVTGNYTLQLSNEYGDVSCSARFRLHEVPQVIEPLKDVEFLEDETSKLVCKVSGVPIPEISWTKDGKPWSPDGVKTANRKDGEEGFILLFDAAKTEDSAHYVAKISNVEGSVTTEATVIVNTPPHILRSNFKDGITFIAMHKLVLEVEATAVPEAEATWYCQGKELKEETDEFGSVKFGFDGRVYTMERIGSDPVQSGEYKCKLKNKIKEVEEVGIVTIIEKESRVRMALKDVEIKEFTDLHLQCQIVGDPIPSVQWLRDGELITDSERFEIKEDRENRMHYLTFKNVTEQDKSTFTVRGTNEHGSCETSCLMTVHVVPQPDELQDVVVDWGQDLLLSLRIHAIPYPEVVWMKDGKVLEEGDRIKYMRDEKNEVYSVQVKAVVLEDDGIYSFKATNCVGEATGQATVKIHSEPPKILEELRDVDMCLEDEITFEVRTNGLPPVEVEWQNKGQSVTGDKRYTTDSHADSFSLTLKDIQLEDYGEIKVTSKNVVGTAESTCQLKQKLIACEVLEGLSPVTKAGEGDDIKLCAKIRASPRPQFVWTRDGDVIEESNRFHMKLEKITYCDAYLSLTIMQAYSDMIGQYRLRFKNEVNEAATETAVIIAPVRKPPVINTKPSDLVISEMEPTTIKCNISGFPKPDVKWYKDGREVRPTDLMNVGVSADGTHYIEFKHVRQGDTGRYSLVATNDEGVAETEMNLTVEPSSARPVFLQKMQPTKVIKGYPCRMGVKLDGFPTPKVSWLFNGKPLAVDGIHVKELIDDDGTAILQIDSATEDDIGSYTVIAANEFGQNESTADLAVLDHERLDGQPDGPAEFTEGLKDSCFDEGKTIRLPVSVKGGPVPDMKWYKDGKEIKLDDRTFFTYDGDTTYLEIYPCHGDDSGTYKCVIENESGKAETECEVAVRKCFEKPSFTQTFPGQEQVPGGDVKLTVKADGVPRPEISWLFNGEPIVPSQKMRIRKEPDGSTLYIKGVDYDDSGVFKAIANNREGEISHKAGLRVGDDVDPSRKYEPPTFLKVIGDQELYEDYTARFKAIVRGRPTPDFDWFKNGVKLFPSKRMAMERDLDGVLRLTIRNVCEEDMGVYELKVWNDYGEVSCKGKLICECLSRYDKRPVGDEYEGFDKIRKTGAPIPLPETPIISMLSDSRVTLTWLPYLPSGPVPPVTYQVEMCELPEGDWVTAASGIRGCSVDITTLNPKSDYRFRVRVENRYGVSEPSPYVATHRNRLEQLPVSHEPKLDCVYDGPKDGPYVPKGFSLDLDSRGKFSAAPRFLKLPFDTQYGMKNFDCRLKWIVFGYPTPKLKFYYKDKEISFGKGSNFQFTYEPSGEACIYLNRINENDVGWYKCVATNEYGESQQRIRLALSEYPRVIHHLQETRIQAHGTGKIWCRISAFPPCDVKWYKDWHELVPSIKHKPQFYEPDIYCLNFIGPAMKDSGLYSIAAVNVAGSVSSSGMVHIEDDEYNFWWADSGKAHHVDINARKSIWTDIYDIGDEIGRGTQSVVYHCVEHHTGRNFAAKSMTGDDNLKVWMKMEYEMINMVNGCRRIVRLYDAYEDRKNMTLITELCSGGEILNSLTKRDYLTEHEIAIYIKQVLEGLEYMHDRCIAHLGLNVGDIMFTRPNGLDVKFGDLSLARHIRMNKLQPLEYGMPEFVSPEIANGEKVSYPADMWAVGVITYLLLSGTSPFRGENDKETLTRVQKGELCFDMEAFSHISAEAKDFIAKLLQFKPDNRMDVKCALRHPWIAYADMSPRDPHKINTDRLRVYYGHFRSWYRNASCRTWFRRRPLAGAFTHPTKMVYPPYEIYTPEKTPEREIKDAYPEDYEVPHKDFSYEVGLVTSESKYTNGPDTYLLQLRDSNFPARLRQYMNVAKTRSPSFNQRLRTQNYDYEISTDDTQIRKYKAGRIFKPTQFIQQADGTRDGEEIYTIRYGRRAQAMERVEKYLTHSTIYS